MTAVPYALKALRHANDAIEFATDVLSGETGSPMATLRSDEIAIAFYTLAGVMVEIDEALRRAERGAP